MIICVFQLRGKYNAKCLYAGEVKWMKWDTLSQFSKQIPLDKCLSSIIKANVRLAD